MSAATDVALTSRTLRAVEVRVLGPLEVEEDGRVTRIEGDRQLTLLALLALSPGRVVSADRLVDALWGEAPAVKPANALQARVSKLRRTIGASRVRGRRPGYILDVPAGDVDAVRFERLAADGRRALAAGDPVDAAGLLDAALSLWRGDALAGLDDPPPALSEHGERLRELRLGAVEDRLDALLALGRHAEIVPELETLVRAYPLRERLCAQLMVALYRASRQADALGAFQEARRMLGEELGLEPGPVLRDLERRILAHDAALGWQGVAVAAGRPGAFAPPPLGRHHVARRRLTSLLDDACEARLVLLSAPAGSGKTAALAEWAADRDDTGWLALDSDDDDPAVFWPSCALALGLAGTNPVRGPAELSSLLATQAVSTGRRILVLDDYHAVSNSAIHDGVDRLLAGAPPSFRLVIATRHDPPLTLARFRVHGDLREVRLDDLRLTDEETLSLLTAHVDADITPSDAACLAQRTEGWAAGVQLAALSMAQEPDPTAFVRDFAGDDRHVADYLREEVLARLPDGLQSFVRETAILDRMTAGLCDAVTGRADGQAILEELERRNLFVVPLDRRRRWYRYHQLFAEWLRLHTGPAANGHRRAAAWLDSAGFAGDALRHHLAAGDVDRAAEVVERERWVLVGQGRQATLQEWIRLLPDAVLRRRRRLTVAAAWVAYDAGHWDAVDRFVRVLRAAEGRGRLDRAELELLAAGRLAALGQLDAAGDIAAAALELLPEDEPRARTGLLLVLGKSRLGRGDLEGAVQAFDAAHRLAQPFGLSVVEVIARCHLAEAARRAGDTDAAESQAREVIAFATANGLGDHPELAVAHLALGNALLDLANREEGGAQVRRGMELATRIPYEPRRLMAEAAAARLDGAVATAKRANDFGETLTDREADVLRLLPTQLAIRDIAAELYLSLNTVKTHMRTLYRKLGVSTRHAAIEQARQKKLI